MSDLTQVSVNGVSGTVLNCPYCQHTNPPQCPKCKPFGTEICIGCVFRYDGGIPVTTTIAPGLMNDDPISGGTITVTMNPSGKTSPPGHAS